MIDKTLLTRDFTLPGHQNKSQIQMTRFQLSSEHRDTLSQDLFSECGIQGESLQITHKIFVEVCLITVLIILLTS